MTPEQKKLNMLGLANRSGNLISVEVLVEYYFILGRVALVLCAQDVSDTTRARYQDWSQRYHVPLDMTFNREQISHAVGKTRSIVAISNQGMAKTYLSY
ncbi:50S ribosomal protein L7ae [Abiotrophia defectiva]|uniref:L7Ae/L30e/S12e/Gadd45 family ribosomal protein n=1 Tax=Abiotrophia defectiva TaxID=46125 RepID=UPI0028D65D81|nr:50S ribosomal protein L7ae [Abiotrophia defectiva]